MERCSVPFLFTFSHESILLNMTNDWKDRLGVVFSTNQDYNYEYDDGEVQTTADVIKGETHFSFDRRKSMGIGNNGSTIDEIGKRLSNFRDKKLKSESK